MLTNNEIKKQIKEGNIVIDGLKESSLSKPNSCSVGIEDVLWTFDNVIIDTKENYDYANEVFTEIASRLKRVKIPKEGFMLEPHKVYLAKTREKIKTDGYIPLLHGKTSLSLLGVSIELNSGYEQNYFDGHFLLSIICSRPTIIYPNIEIGNLTFFKSLGPKNENDWYKNGMLSGEEIKRRMTTSTDIVIEPQDRIVINPNSVNLTLNKTMAYYTEPILDMRKNNPFETFEIGENGITLEPDIYLARTNEWTETRNLVPILDGRSSTGRLGLHMHCSGGLGSNGFKGYWHLGVRPTIPIKDVYANMKCCQISYYTLEGEITNTYDGSMQELSGDELGSQSYKKLTLENKK